MNNYSSSKIIGILKGLYDISFELGEEAFAEIRKYREERVDKKIKKSALEKASGDGKIDLETYRKELTTQKIIGSVKDID